MKLKCIGGPKDGCNVDTYNNKPRIGEIVRIPLPQEVKVLDYFAIL